jgi:DNA-binding CsgD family transcriptional regulator
LILNKRGSATAPYLQVMVGNRPNISSEVSEPKRLSRNLSAIATAFDAAAENNSKWNTAMETVAAAAASCKAMLLPVPPEETQFSQYHTCGWIDHVLDRRGVSKLLRDGVISNADCGKPECRVPPERESVPWFAGVKVTAGSEAWCLLIQRSIEQGPFSRTELRELADLSPVLSKAATEARFLGFARAEGALSVFGLLNLPAALLDRYGELVHMNQAAKQLFGDDVTIRRGQVISFDHDATMALSQVLIDFMSSGHPSVLMPFVSLPRRGDRRPLLVSAMRLSEISQGVFARCQAVLIFFDLDRHARPSEAVLRQCLGLSAAEARLAIGLATGESLQAQAKQLKISKETARHELKSVFAKLNVHRQSELVALLSLLPHLRLT